LPGTPQGAILALQTSRNLGKCRLKCRIDEAAKYAPLDQLCLSPQCGFSSTVDGNALTIEEEKAKLRLVVETAREVWG
jgi:5-methyltetrahydropteroyltriglutamate--homocysteine methyltransferase